MMKLEEKLNLIEDARGIGLKCRTRELAESLIYLSNNAKLRANTNPTRYVIYALSSASPFVKEEVLRQFGLAGSEIDIWDAIPNNNQIYLANISNVVEEHLWLPFRRDVLINILLEKGIKIDIIGKDVLLENMRLYVDSQKEFVAKHPIYDSAYEDELSEKQYILEKKKNNEL